MFQSFFLKLKNVWGYDANEKALLKNAVSRKTRQTTPHGSKKIIIQAPSDHYFLALYSQVVAQFIEKGGYQIGAFLPTIFSVKQKRDLLFPFRVIYAIINNYLIHEKWLRLYRAIGVEVFYSIDKVNLVQRISYVLQAVKIWRGITSKQELIDTSLNGVYCGDLIYDTYLRYRVRPTVSIKDPFVAYYIYKSFCVINAMEKFVAENLVTDYFASYSTYIQHGIPARIFLKHDINVYTSGNFQQRFKKLTPQNVYHTASHEKYAKIFSTLSNQQNRIIIGNDLLSGKFKGIIDKATSYMKKSAYDGGKQSGKLAVDGVVFLHDFYDSPHIYSTMIFEDFYEWVDHTFNLILKYKLNVGVKPHPNQVADSKKDIQTLQRRFPSIQWIDSGTSNLQIINSGIKYGISIYGTILHELAYHGIIPICAGDNPHTSFSFVKTPKTKAEYDELILKAQTLTLPKDYKEQVGAFYYMHNIYDKEDFKINENLFKNYHILNSSSELLLKLIPFSK